jgi:phosphoglycerate dehydrogenase-like enzyme
MALRVATQLAEPFHGLFAARAPDVEFLAVPRGTPPPLPDDTTVLVAAPFTGPGQLPAVRPAGWPWRLQWVQLISVGIDFYPPWLFDGPVVTSVRGTSAIALAEYALAAMLAEAKQLPDLWLHRAADWRQRPLASLDGATLGIFGFGAIGAALASRAQALGLRVIATRASAAPLPPGVARVDADTLFAQSDHLVLAAPLTPATRHIVNARRLALAKPGLHLINVARGGLVDQPALLAALDAGHVAAATLDVTEPEPLPEGHAFYTHPRVRLSAHTAVVTPQTRAAVAQRFADNLARFRNGEPLADQVDPSRGY